MANLSPRGRLTATGAGAAFLALLMAPMAHADADPGYADLSALYDSVATFENSFSLYEDSVFYSDLASLGNIISASGIDVGVPFPSGADASDDVNTILAQGNTIVNQLTEVQSEITNDYGNITVLAGTDDKELPVVEEALTFQQQIDADIANLPTITSADETNPLLIDYLSAISINETNLDNYVVNLTEQLLNASPAGLSGDNAVILADGLGFLTDVQGASETLTLLADLSSLGL